MKRICGIGGIIILIVFLVMNFFSRDSEKSIYTGNFTFKEELNINLIDSYSKSKGEEKNQLEYHIKNLVIRDMKLDEWSKYLEEVEMKTYNLDLINGDEKELLISLNLAKNLGVLGIYKLEGELYSLVSKVENLTNIENITVEKNKKTGQKFLVLEEFLDERIGAYFIDKFMRIFIEKDGEFREVLRQSRDYEAYYYEKWIDPNKETSKWYRLNEKNIIEYDFKDNGQTIIDIHKTLNKSEGLNGTASKIPTEFKEVEKRNFDIKYMWNDEYNTFIIGEGKLIATGEKVAILEDTSKTVDYLLNLGDKYYKVVNKNMKTKYVKEKEINITKDK